MKKKIIAILMVMLLCASMLTLTACGGKNTDEEDKGNDAENVGNVDDTNVNDADDNAADDGSDDTANEAEVDVFVSVASEGALVFGNYMTVIDMDKDGALTISDAIACAHLAGFEGGNEAGYATAETEYGLSVTKLWGIENGGSYGFYLNNAYVDSLLAPLTEGDVVSAFSYADLTGWSDAFCYFDKITAESDGEITLTLTYLAFDENYNTVPTPVNGAKITVDGAETEFVTDENGSVTITAENGEHVVSAISDTMTLVPPVCIITVG